MPENETDTQTQDKVESKIVSVGKPTTVTMNVMAGQQGQPSTEEVVGARSADTDLGKEKIIETPAITEDQKIAFFKELGIDYKGEEDLAKVREKLNFQPNVEATDEQKQATRLAEEKEILDLFISNGGTAENFVAIKGIANADVKELSRQETINEYIAAGFDKGSRRI